jgi:hypothetical protein
MSRPSLNLANDHLRRAAGAGALIYVAAFAVAAVITGQPTVHDGQGGIEHSFVDGGLERPFAGVYLLALGFLVLLPTMVFLSGALGRRSPFGSWAAQTATLAGAAYIVVIVGVGFSAGAAALWAHQQALDLPSVLALNNVRNFAHFIATPFMGLYAIALGIAAISDRLLNVWVGWGGVTVGVAFLLAVPAAVVGVQFAMPLWLLWWVGNGIALLRHRPAVDNFHTEQPPLETSLRHD